MSALIAGLILICGCVYLYKSMKAFQEQEEHVARLREANREKVGRQIQKAIDEVLEEEKNDSN